MDARFYLANAWRRLAGVLEIQTPNIPAIESLRESEWSPKFERLMRNRLIMGAFRYGLLNATGKPKYDRMDSIAKRAKLYKDTGNIEILVDIANMALLEFEEGDHDSRHFKAADDGLHTDLK